MTKDVGGLAIDDATWAEIEPLVSSVVRDVEGRTPYSSADLKLAVSRLAQWATTRAALEADRDLLLRREVIGRFIDYGCPGLTEATRGNTRTQLLRVAEVLLDPALAPRRLKPLNPADPSAPYSPSELAALDSWVLGQTTKYRSENAQILIALGLGAGLSASEIGTVRARDVERDAAGVMITVAEGRRRSVPVVEEWEDRVWDRAWNAEPESFMFRPAHEVFYATLITNFVDRGHTGGLRPKTQRMRATWIVEHLDAGTPVGPLLAAAGVDSLEAFTRYVGFLKPVDSIRSRALLRLGRNR